MPWNICSLSFPIYIQKKKQKKNGYSKRDQQENRPPPKKKRTVDFPPPTPPHPFQSLAYSPDPGLRSAPMILIVADVSPTLKVSQNAQIKGGNEEILQEQKWCCSGSYGYILCFTKKIQLVGASIKLCSIPFTTGKAMVLHFGAPVTAKIIEKVLQEVERLCDTHSCLDQVPLLQTMQVSTYLSAQTKN